ncbi:RNB domain-containing protein [Bowdeniella nasicola]|uniref:RNB domain-containing protein n=1 Tax=Bowdeniella nasicola TaxID=208480 RepID=A0A1H3WZQ3_9ACTO|nr:RNB domain-containing ribonuclease [Bowdeniella nasicola]SDZ92463.1 RNB domain-containing protein [Bowdeniella nasicola]
MPRRRFLLTAESATIDRALAELRAELEIREDFPSDVLAQAQDAAAQGLPAPGSLPEHGRPSIAPVDMRELPFVTVDPPSSMDLDQAAYLTRGSDAGEAGYTIYYAIACLAFMVRPGGPLDTEVRERGTSIYGPGHVIALHPEAISADAASLLPGEDRLAYVWQIGLDAEGAMTSYSVRPALVRSRAKLSYTDVQRALDGAGELEGEVPADFPQLLERIGQLRIAREAARGGVSLDIPEQEVAESPDGYVLSYRANLPVESYNAQLSLATGIAAARIMRRAGTGILRTLPPAEERDLRRLRHTARALGLSWPSEMTYQDFVRSLSSADAAAAAFLNEATTLFRGSGYLAFAGGAILGEDGEATEPLGESHPHAAIAAEYAHVTAPLRRLVDRYGLEICAAACAGEPIAPWAVEGLACLPAIMARTSQLASRYERRAIDLVEAAVLSSHIGETFSATVIDARNGGGTVLLRTPAVRGRVAGDLAPGTRVTVRVRAADPTTGTIELDVVDADAGGEH